MGGRLVGAGGGAPAGVELSDGGGAAAQRRQPGHPLGRRPQGGAAAGEDGALQVLRCRGAAAGWCTPSCVLCSTCDCDRLEVTRAASYCRSDCRCGTRDDL